MHPFAALATLALVLHLAFIAWVLLGWIWTRHRPLLAGLHVASLAWGIIVEVGPWPCPLTVLEQDLERRAGVTPWSGSFILHSLDALIYPNLPWTLVASAGAGICVAILGIHAARGWRHFRPPESGGR